MLDAYQPMSLTLALWPTQDFEFPADDAAWGERLRAQFGLFRHLQLVRPMGDVPMPAEMPRLILTADQQRWTLELAPGKVTLRWVIPQKLPLAVCLEQFRAQLMPVEAWLAENHNFRPYRIGCLVQLFCATRSSANEKIAQYFLQPRALQGQPPHEIQLGILARCALGDGTLVNRWFRVRPLRTNDPRHVDFAAQIDLDFNTLPENTQVKTARDLENFLAAIDRQVEGPLSFFRDPEFLE